MEYRSFRMEARKRNSAFSDLGWGNTEKHSRRDRAGCPHRYHAWHQFL